MFTKSSTRPIVFLVSFLVLAGCESTHQNIGTVSGTVIGGVVGNQFGNGAGRTAATILGALAGGIIGREIGVGLDQRNQQHAVNAEYNALENGASGRPVQWQGDNGVYGEVVPQQTYQVGSQNCRRYTHTVYIDGQPKQARGTACRNPDGTWSLLS